MRWTFALGRRLEAAEIEDFERIPAVKAWPAKITTSPNAGPLVRDLLAAKSVPFSVTFGDPVITPLGAKRALAHLRPWVPEFLTSYQKAGIAFALGAPDGSAILFHPAGSGKTIEEIVWALAAPARTIVVTKAAVRRQYAGEVERFTDLVPTVIEGEETRRLGVEDHFVILSYELLPAWIGELERWASGLQLRPSVVFDEIHKVQSHKRWDAEVEKPADAEGDSNVIVLADEKPKVRFTLKDNVAAAAMRLTRLAGRRLGGTATPMRDRVRNLWAQLDLIHPYAWGNYWTWAKRYCNAFERTFGGMDDSGSSNPKELQTRLSIVMHRVEHAEVNRMLPPLRRIVTYVGIRDQVAAGMVNEIRAAARNGAAALREALLMEAAARKRRRLMEKIEIDVEAGLKTVVFTGRRLDCDRIRAACEDRFLGKALIVGGHGGDTPEERERQRVRYMEAAGPAILIGTADAWGECVPADTFISGANKPIEKLAAGDPTFGESGLTACSDMKAHPYNGTMIEIRAQGMLPVLATVGHPILTVSGSITRGRGRRFVAGDPTWLDVERVRPWDPSPRSPIKARGDFVLIPRVQGRFSDVVFDLNLYTTGSNAANGRKTRGCPTTVALDAELAWIIGLYVAEGSATDQRRPGGCRATWSLGGHESGIAKRVIRALEARGFHARIRLQGSALNVVTSSAPLARLLRDLAGNGAHHKRIPNEILFHSDLAILRAFLEGYAVGDGSISDAGNRVQAATVSKALALNLQLALARFGRLAAITPWQGPGTKIEGRLVRGGPYFIVTWRWKDRWHARFKVLDRYIAVPVKKALRYHYDGLVASMTTTDGTFLVSNAVVHNGLNLQDTDHMLVALLPYTPGAVIQAEGRVARLGQKRPVLIEYMVAEGTYDERVATILLSKLPALERVINQDEVRGFSRDLSGADDPDMLTNLAAKIIGGTKRRESAEENA